MLGYADTDTLYAVYYYGSSDPACGGGAWPPTLVGHVAALYLEGEPPGAAPCSSNSFATDPDSPGYLEFAMLHEILHTLGVVPECAPHETRAGHASDDPRDLMWSGDAPWQPSILDVGRDDCFRHGRAGCPDLADSAFLDPYPLTPQPHRAGSGPIGIGAARLQDMTPLNFVCGAVNPNAPGWVVLGRADGSLLLLSPRGEGLLRLRVDTPILGVHVDPPRNRLVTLEGDGALTIRSLVDGSTVRGYPRYSDQELRYTGYSSLSASADGARVLGGGRVVDTDSGELLAELHSYMAVISPDGRLFAHLGGERQVEFVTVDNGLPRDGWCEPNFERIGYAMAWAPAGSPVAVSGWDKYTYRDRECIWLASADQEVLEPLTWGPAEFRRLRFSPDGRVIAWATEDMVVGLSPVVRGKDVILQRVDADVVEIGFWSADQFLVATSDGEIILWSLAGASDERAPDHVILRPRGGPSA